MKDKVEFWDRIARKYDSKSLETYKDAYDATVDLSLKWVEGRKNVLEYACGTGITTIRFAGYAEKISAVDISERMIDEARKLTEGFSFFAAEDYNGALLYFFAVRC